MPRRPILCDHEVQSYPPVGGGQKWQRLGRRILSAACLLSALPFTLAAAPNCTIGHSLSDNELLSIRPQKLASTLTLDQLFAIEQIRIFRQDIFVKPKSPFYRRLNEWHPSTNTSTILSSLPFSQGDVIDQVLVDEAERILRTLPYFYDARILIRRTCADSADLDIVVREVWTLTPNISFSREGGESNYRFGVADTNWRGTGKALSLAYEQKPPEERIELKYKDHARQDKWLRSLSVEFGSNAYRYALSFGKPFLATTTKDAKGFSASSARFPKKLYQRSKELTRFDSTNKRARLFHARTLQRAPHESRYARTYVGIQYLSEHVEAAFIDGQIVFAEEDSEFIYPFVAWESSSNRFAKLPHTSHFGRDEYFKLGWNTYVELGYGLPALGANDKSIHLQYRLGRHWLIRDQHIASARLDVTGRFVKNTLHPENLVSNLNAEYLHSFKPESKVYFSLDLTHGRNLDHANFFDIGGESGMRGYRNHFQTGSRRYMLVAEYRHDTSLKPLNLFAMGFVAFAEAGRAWFSAAPVPWQNIDQKKLLQNVGIGLRLHSLRTGSDQTIHIDFARPLTHHRPGSAYELSFTVRKQLL